MDALFLLGRKRKPELKPLDCVARYVVVKHHQWRGQYKRILCITPSEVLTQDPAQNLHVTNTYSFLGDADIDSIQAGPGPDEFVISARGDKKSRSYKPLKFACKQRTQLLTDLFQCIAAASALGRSSLAYKILG